MCSERTQVGVSMTSVITWFQPESGTRRVPIGVGNGLCMFVVCSGYSYRIKYLYLKATKWQRKVVKR